MTLAWPVFWPWLFSCNSMRITLRLFDVSESQMSRIVTSLGRRPRTMTILEKSFQEEDSGCMAVLRHCVVYCARGWVWRTGRDL